MDESNEQVIERREDRPPFVHSVRVRGPLTMRYWDYLAWATERARPQRLLVLGLGGGTVLQLLERRGVTPPCVAVDLDPHLTESLRRHGWLTYPGLAVVHEDARQFLARQPPTELFDVILVDVYDEQGYVRELYDSLLRCLVSHLSPDGVVLLHCLDPMAKFPSFRVVMPDLPQSPSCSVAERLASLGMAVAVYPLWSSALVASSRSSSSLEWSTENEVAGGVGADAMAALAWCNHFWADRRMSLAELRRFLQPFDGEYTYANLERLDAGYLATLAAGTAASVRAMLHESLPLPEVRGAQEGAIVRELLPGGRERDLTATTMHAAMVMKALLERTTPGARDSEPLVEAVCRAARAGDNPALARVESFALAWSGDFTRALSVLRESIRR